MKFCLIFIILIILLSFIIYKCLVKIDKDCSNIEIYSFQGKEIGPSILIIGGQHGNEPAGSVACDKLLEQLQKKGIKRGKCYLIPKANPCGLKLGIRSKPPFFTDINRLYKEKNNLSHPIAKRISRLMEECDLIIDLHEGWGFHRIHPQSMGSALYHRGNRELGELIVHNLNKDIFEEHKKFDLLPPSSVKNTVQEMGGHLGKKTFLLETTGQENIQPLPLRVSQHLTALQTVLEYFEMV